MSQRTTPGTRPAAPTTGPQRAPARPQKAARPTAGSRTPQTRAWYRTSPGKLSLVRTGCLLAIALFAVAAIVCGSTQSGTLHGVADASSRLASLQQVKHELVQADAAVANGFLLGGLETSQQRESYEGYVNHAATTLPDLAAGDEHLDGIVADLTTYAGLIEQARANNRQGFPVGAGYLEQASTVLRGQVLTALDAATEAQAAQIQSDLAKASRLTTWMPIILVVLVAALIAAQIWLARKTHRRFNPPLVLASLLVIGCAILAGATVSSAEQKAAAAAGGPYATMNELSAALADASQAKALESRVLISRGANPQLTTDMDAAEKRADARIDQAGNLAFFYNSAHHAAVTDAYRTWTAAHDQIASTNNDGNWDQAVSLATATSNASANTAFGTFVTEIDQAVSTARATTLQNLDAAASSSARMCWIAAIIALLAWIPTWLGFGRRIKEYR